MREDTRLQLGDLSSLRTNHQEARQQSLPCLLKVRCLKKRERKKEERDESKKGGVVPPSFFRESEFRELEIRATNGLFSFTPWVAESISAGKVSLWWTVLHFIERLFNLDILYQASVFLITHPELSVDC
ncbi:hypothetical protein AVEN_211507-1 [Araneus ventricosus]|uniref:Uncharacterized protein n=1 Tax=Araneus ventricosus TaxID=182803 RepID=A0A4Y2JMZ5_ARAVE|nr:hypothetical protein AVEN_211507-1 [Araneus ventricosus]